MLLPDQTRIFTVLKNLVITVSVAIVLMAFYLQLQMPAEGDSGFLNYFAWLFNEKDMVPYRDAFDTSFPMALLFHMTLTSIAGYTDLGFQLTNVALQLLLMLLTWRMAARLSPVSAIIGALSFIVVYAWVNAPLGREFQCLLWLVCAICLLLETSQPAHIRIALASVFLGMAASVKPHFIITVLPLIWFVWQTEKPSLQEAIKLVAIATLTGITVIALPFLWLWYNGGLEAFLDIFTGYLPLYLSLSGASDVITSSDRFTFMAEEWWNMSKYILPPVALGLYVFLKQEPDPARKNLAILFAAEAIICNLYIIPAGKFWIFQMLPYLYFSILVITLGFSGVNRTALTSSIAVLLVVFITAINLMLAQGIYEKKIARFSDEIGDYLVSKQVTDNERVQIWQYNTDGVRGLLNAGVITATPHMTYEPFYHHLTDPYTIRIKQEFLTQIQQAKPKYLIRESRLFIPRGNDTDNRFDEFDRFISENYTVDKKTDYYTFYIRKT